MTVDPNATYTTKPIEGVIADVDSDFAWKRIVSRGYVFSNGRSFYQREVPGQAYDWVDD